MTHTLGPWKVEPCPENGGKHVFHDNRHICAGGWNPSAEYPQHETPQWAGVICDMRDVDPANAHLIAAAPAMYNALLHLNMANNTDTLLDFTEARAVLATIDSE